MSQNTLIARTSIKQIRITDPKLADALEAILREIDDVRGVIPELPDVEEVVNHKIPYDSGDFSLDTLSPTSWVVTEANIKNLSYTKQNQLVILNFDIDTTNVPAATTFLAIRLPDDIVPIIDARTPIQTTDTGVAFTGFTRVIPSGVNNRYLLIYKDLSGTNWAISANVSMRGQIVYTTRY